MKEGVLLLDTSDATQKLDCNQRGRASYWILQITDKKLCCNKLRGPAYRFCIYRFHTACIHLSLFMKGLLKENTS